MKGAALPTGRLANQGVLSHMYNVSEKDSVVTGGSTTLDRRRGEMTRTQSEARYEAKSIREGRFGPTC